MRSTTKIFLSGVLCHSGLRCLQQDLMGMEGYLQYAESNWVSGGIGIPLALISLIVAMCLYTTGKTQLTEG